MRLSLANELHHPDVATLRAALDRFYQNSPGCASLCDLLAFARGRGTVRTFPIPSGSVKDWLVKNALQINAAITNRKTHLATRA